MCMYRDDLEGHCEHLVRHPHERARGHRPKGSAYLVRERKEVDKVVNHFGRRIRPDGPRTTASKHHVEKSDREKSDIVFDVC